MRSDLKTAKKLKNLWNSQRTESPHISVVTFAKMARNGRECVLVPEDTKGSENMVCEEISVGRLNTSLFVTDWLLYCDMEPEEEEKRRKEEEMIKFQPFIILQDNIKRNVMHFQVKQYSAEYNVGQVLTILSIVIWLNHKKQAMILLKHLTVKYMSQ